jgi:acyl-CoA synthetase (AMP-forming)/AMP-acid ligase II
MASPQFRWMTGPLRNRLGATSEPSVARKSDREVWTGTAPGRQNAGLDRSVWSERTEGRSRLTRFKVPKRIVFLPAIPKNATGKIQKREVKEILAQSMARVDASE